MGLLNWSSNQLARRGSISARRRDSRTIAPTVAAAEFKFAAAATVGAIVRRLTLISTGARTHNHTQDNLLIILLDIWTNIKVYCFVNFELKNDVMTSRRRCVIENCHYFYFLRCALVQSTIPENLVKISQQTKKVIGLQVGWWGVGWGSSNVFSYILQPGVVPLSDRCFDSVGVSFRVGTTLPGF